MTSSSGRNGELGDLGTVTTLRRVPVDPETEKEDARRTIALRLVWAYLGVLAVNAIIPVAMLLWVGTSASSNELSAVKDFIAPIAAGTASVTGVIGFVLGYYFKSEETQRKRK